MIYLKDCKCKDKQTGDWPLDHRGQCTICYGSETDLTEDGQALADAILNSIRSEIQMIVEEEIGKAIRDHIRYYDHGHGQKF